MPSKELTIAVPTFNRSTAVTSTLRRLLADRSDNNYSIMVIDNGSADGTEKTLLANFPDSGEYDLIRYDSNFGYFESFLRLFEECKTSHLLFLSDEDELNQLELGKLTEFILDSNPSFVSTNFFRNGKLYRGGKGMGRVEVRDFETASFYVSGLVFDTLAVKKYLDTIRELSMDLSDIYQTLLFRLR